MKFKKSKKNLLLLVCSLFIGFSLSGCGEFNDNPADKSSVTVNIKDLQKQLGYDSTNMTRSVDQIKQDDTNTTTKIESLIIGAVVISRSEPYASDEPFSDEDGEQLGTDVANSIDSLMSVNLPVYNDTIEIQLPVPSSSQWQVVAVGLSKQITSIADFIDEQVEDADDKEDIISYIGFTENAYNTNDVNETTPIEIKMRRTCFINKETKGCATFYNDADGEPIVTSSVDIIDIKYAVGENSEKSITEADCETGAGINLNDIYSNKISADSRFTFPFKVRDVATSEIVSAAEAKTFFELIRGEGTEIRNFKKGDYISVITAHTESYAEGHDCRDLTLSDYENECGYQIYRVPIAFD